MRKIFFILSICIFINPVYAKQDNAISNLMQGLTTPTCINLMKKLEDEQIPENLELRTIPNLDRETKIFSAFTVVNYNGQDSHISTTAIPNGDNKCSILYNESYSFAGPCIIAREQAFSKWKFLGKLVETLAFSFKRDKELFGFLTQQGNNRTCLIQKRKTYTN